MSRCCTSSKDSLELALLVKKNKSSCDCSSWDDMEIIPVFIKLHNWRHELLSHLIFIGVFLWLDVTGGVYITAGQMREIGFEKGAIIFSFKMHAFWNRQSNFIQNRTFLRPGIKAMKISYYEEVALLIFHHNLITMRKHSEENYLFALLYRASLTRKMS